MSYSSKKTNKSLYFTEDIIEELSAKTGKDKALLSDIIHHNLNYLKKEISNNEEIVVVNFPNLGKLMFNYYLGKCSISLIQNKKINALIKKRVNFLNSILTKFNDNSLKVFNKPIVSTLIYQLTGSTSRNSMKSFYKDWKELENKHNKNHEKYF